MISSSSSFFPSSTGGEAGGMNASISSPSPLAARSSANLFYLSSPISFKVGFVVAIIFNWLIRRNYKLYI